MKDSIGKGKCQLKFVYFLYIYIEREILCMFYLKKVGKVFL